MRNSRTALLTGAAVIILAGVAGTAMARTAASGADTHVLNLRLPDGQLEQVRYTGKVPPLVVLAPEAMNTSFALASPFALLQQMSADMDRQAAAMFQTMNMAQVPSGEGLGMISGSSGAGVCARSIQITFTGNGHAPHVVPRTSGDCGPSRGPAVPTALPNEPVPSRVPSLIEAKSASPYQGMFRTVSDVQR